MMFSNAGEMITKSYDLPSPKESALKAPCPDFIKMYNKWIDEIDVDNQKATAYNLDCKPSFRFYWCIFSKLY